MAIFTDITVETNKISETTKSSTKRLSKICNNEVEYNREFRISHLPEVSENDI